MLHVFHNKRNDGKLSGFCLMLPTDFLSHPLPPPVAATVDTLLLPVSLLQHIFLFAHLPNRQLVVALFVKLYRWKLTATLLSRKKRRWVYEINRSKKTLFVDKKESQLKEKNQALTLDLTFPRIKWTLIKILNPIICARTVSLLVRACAEIRGQHASSECCHFLIVK